GLAGRRIAGPASHHLPCGDRWLTSGIVLHPPAARCVLAAERKLDATLVLRWPARDHRPIAFFDLPALEQPAEVCQRLAVAGEKKAPRGIRVEAVRERGRARKPETHRVEIVFQALAAFGSLVNRQPGGLVDRQHEAIAIDEPSHYLFRRHGHLPTLGET